MARRKNAHKKDVLIIAGDFGLIWSYYRTAAEDHWLKWLDDRPWTTLFIDGNHENFDILDRLPQKMLFGSPVGIVGHSVFHLKRGELYKINGKKILAFGGADSEDKHLRTIGVSLWEQERITWADVEKAISSVEYGFFSVDCIVSHCAPTSFVKSKFTYFNESPSENALEEFKNRSQVSFGKWVFGHYHMDFEDGNVRAIYNDIIELKD